MNLTPCVATLVLSVCLANAASAQDEHKPAPPAPTPAPAPQDPPPAVSVESFVKRLTISGEFRARFEFRDPLGYGNPVQLEESQDLLHIRTRLNLDAQVTDHVRFFLQIQDQRFAGQEPTSVPQPGNPLLAFSTASGDAKNTDVHQGYMDIQNLWDQDLDIRIGRFAMCYGSRRFL